MRIQHLHRYFLICAVLVLVYACNGNELLQDGRDSSLRLVIGVPEYGVELKGTGSDPVSPDKWSSWERAVDGRYIYRVTAFILQGSRLVAHQDLELYGEVQEAELDFEANFTHGSYTLMVVANWSAFEAEDGSNGIRKYNGLGQFAEVVEDILDHTTIDNFTDLYSSSFIKWTLSSENGVCARVPQPLTLVKEIELKPGTNVISGELVRTYSRIRISVENNSDEELKISSMSFSDIFSQKSAYVFDGTGYIQERTSVDVESTNAIIPFTATESEPVVVPAKGSSAVFDAYILESRKSSDNEEYSYSLGLGYSNLNSYTLKSRTAVNKSDNVTTGHYLIYNTSSSKYLTAGTSSVATASLQTLYDGMTIPAEYVWTFDNSGLQSKQFYIGTAAAMENGQTAYYMSNPTRTSVVLGASKSVYFTVGGGNSYVNFRSNGTGKMYVYVDGSSVKGNTNTSNSGRFVLYPVEVPVVSTIGIPLTAIDNITGQSEQVNEIKRNDFINVVVKVSYSKNQGHFNFEVKDWGTAGGDIEFN